MLKHYIDVIVQPKYLFQYTKNGVEGLAINKKMIAITSRGGAYSSQETKPQDFQESYLRLIFNFVGIQDITFVNAEPMDMGKEMREKSLGNAKETVKDLVGKL
jgi:FMN-dependent NADH-azoreductase